MRTEELENRLKLHSNTVKKSIRIPCNNLELLKKENDIMRTNRKKFSVGKRVAWSLAGVAAAFILVVNTVPQIAYASRNIPVLGQVVRVVTFGRYEVKHDGVDAVITTPKIEGLLDKELEAMLNNEFKEHSNMVIAAFEKDVKELEAEYGNDFHLGVEANYVVRTNNDDIIAIDTYIVNTVGSSSTKHSFYTIDKHTGKLLELKGLFNQDADYITPISEYITTQMKKQNEAGTADFWIVNEDNPDGFEKIKPNQNFFINESGNIVIAFGKYEVAPGAYGCPEFEIPQDVVKNILKQQ